MKYRHNLPQLNDQLFLTDGGLETTLVFLDGIELPLFAAFDLLSTDSGKKRLLDYYADYIQWAKKRKLGFILEAPTWRANADWGRRLGYSDTELAECNQHSIDMLVSLREAYETNETPLVISGCIGPRGDGYIADRKMGAEAARVYHTQQIRTFAESQADLVSAMTINYVDEAIGIVKAAKDFNMPVVISFTTETDGRLPSGERLSDAIIRVDEATDCGPVYYMINCAHPDHFRDALDEKSTWVKRIRGVRANASRKSHAELDESKNLDRGDPNEFGSLYAEMRQVFPNVSILGGCCGTDLEHIESVYSHCCH